MGTPRRKHRWAAAAGGGTEPAPCNSSSCGTNRLQEHGPIVTRREIPETWREHVRSEWCDYNDHLNLAYYVLIFDHATDAFYDSLGLDRSYREATNCSTFAVESHTVYLAELLDGDEVFCTTQLLDYDERRLHYFHRLYHSEKRYLSATTELLAVHVDLGLRKTAPMTPGLLERLSRELEDHRHFPRPDQQGRVIGIRRK